jgi:DNA polymerase ligase (LigD)-like protein
MPARYVILKHTYQGVHFDVMLEVDGKLRTWRLASPPASGQPVAAEASFDHRLLYLDYEGPLSGDRGVVCRWDAGTYGGEARGVDLVAVDLAGDKLRGRLELRLIEDQKWQCAFRPTEE